MTLGVAVAPVIFGGSSSRTCTGNVHVVTVPSPRVAVSVTVVVPIGKNDGDAGAPVTTPQPPLTDARGGVRIAPGWPGSATAVTGAGQLSVHAWMRQISARVVMVRPQPAESDPLPEGPLLSSTTYSDHAPPRGV